MAKIFISYKHGILPDENLATFFESHLIQQGHSVFIDRHIIIGEEWPNIIRQQLEQAEFMLVLLSERAAASEMIIEEVRIAYDLKRHKNALRILPVRISYLSPFPYDLGAMLNRIQYELWETEGDEQAIAVKITEAISRDQPLSRDLVAAAPSTEVVNGDRNETPQSTKHICPLPAFDPQWLEQLDAPGGTLRLSSPFYIQRAVDGRAQNKVLQGGVTVRVKGCRQMGKSSLLARLYQHAKEREHPAIYIDFQRLDSDNFQNLNTLLFYLANLVARRLRINSSPSEYWQLPLGPKDKLTEYLEKEVLQMTVQPVVLLLDEVDRVFTETYRDDFFSLIRAWHNNRSIEPLWEKMNLVLAYSTEAFMFIRDLNQSPFNVGENYELSDFDRSQTEVLNDRHGQPIDSQQAMDDFIELVNGHPYLTRKALYDLIEQRISFGQFINSAVAEDGPYSDHLHRYLWQFLENATLRMGMKSVIDNGVCTDDRVYYQLRSAGLITGTHHQDVKPRCGLYAKYFRRHL